VAGDGVETAPYSMIRTDENRSEISVTASGSDGGAMILQQPISAEARLRRRLERRRAVVQVGGRRYPAACSLGCLNDAPCPPLTSHGASLMHHTALARRGAGGWATIPGRVLINMRNRHHTSRNGGESQSLSAATPRGHDPNRKPLAEIPLGFGSVSIGC
jgi:hypothetical protein